MQAAAIYIDIQAAVEKSKQLQELNNLHFGEAAQTSRSQNLYMPTPGMKQLQQSMSQTQTCLKIMAPAFLSQAQIIRTTSVMFKIFRVSASLS